MHDERSKKLPIRGSNHSYRITELNDAVHHGKLAETHYNNVKRKQCILDYNTAVDSLSNLHDHIMNAQEYEEKMDTSLKDVKELEKKLINTLKEIHENIVTLKKETTAAENRMLLCRAKMQQAGVSISDLDKLRPISQGTQVINIIDDDVEKELDTDPDKIEPQPLPLVQIPQDETDKAIANLIALQRKTTLEEQILQNVAITSASQNITHTSSTTPNIAFTSSTGQNVTLTTSTGQNVAPVTIVSIADIHAAPNAPAPSNVVNLIPQNIAVGDNTLQNIPFGFTPQNAAPTSVYTPILPAGCISVAPPQTSAPSQSVITISDSTSSFEIPSKFKRTRYADTLELTDLKPLPGQKAPKRFFCRKCLEVGVETGYTKRNDLVHHLEGCGLEKEKKFKCEYEKCDASYMRSDNLKQHIAEKHTKKYLYFCKKCNKGFFKSPEASAHRKLCFPIKPPGDHTLDEEKQPTGDPKEDEKEKDADDIL